MAQNENEDECIEDSYSSGDVKYRKKAEEIKYFLRNNDVSSDPQCLKKLRSFALSDGGLINDESDKPPSEDEYKNHAEFSQVVLDVNRSIKRFPPGIPLEQRMAMQNQLIRLILRVIMKYPQLQYYQGYHDVAITFLLVVGEDTAFHIMKKLSTNHLKHFMEPTMEKTSELLDYIFPLIDHIHSQLCEYLESADIGTMFCLPWFLTWYSHTLTKYEHVGRLYDYFLVSEALIPLYLVPAIVVYRQDEIFSTQCDMACLHQLLSELPEDLPFDDLLIQASELYLRYPPEEIHKEASNRRIKRETIQKEKLDKQKQRILRMKANLKKSTPFTSIPCRGWQFMQRVLPAWFLPYGKLRFVLISAGLVVGWYAYCRYSAIPYDLYSSIEEKIVSNIS